MGMEQTVSVDAPVAKAASAWAAAFASMGVTSWSDASAFMGFVASAFAAIYTLCLLWEWLHKKRTKRTRALDAKPDAPAS